MKQRNIINLLDHTGVLFSIYYVH